MILRVRILPVTSTAVLLMGSAEPLKPRRINRLRRTMLAHHVLLGAFAGRRADVAMMVDDLSGAAGDIACGLADRLQARL